MKRKHHLSRRRRRYPVRKRQEAVAALVRGRLRIFAEPSVYEIVETRMKNAYMAFGAQLAIAAYAQPPRYQILGPDGLKPEDYDAV